MWLALTNYNSAVSFGEIFLSWSETIVAISVFANERIFFSSVTVNSLLPIDLPLHVSTSSSQQFCEDASFESFTQSDIALVTYKIKTSRVFNKVRLSRVSIIKSCGKCVSSNVYSIN